MTWKGTVILLAAVSLLGCEDVSELAPLDERPVSILDETGSADTADVQAAPGTNEDWISFFWRLWTNTDYYQFSMDELSDIWAATAENANGGGSKWNDIVNTVEDEWGSNSPQKSAFVNLGALAGVNY